MARSKKPSMLLMSDLLKVGVAYFLPEHTSVLIFNDGTQLIWEYVNCETEYTDLSDTELVCRRLENGRWEVYDLIDDIGFLGKHSVPCLLPAFERKRSAFIRPWDQRVVEELKKSVDIRRLP